MYNNIEVCLYSTIYIALYLSYKVLFVDVMFVGVSTVQSIKMKQYGCFTKIDFEMLINL